MTNSSNTVSVLKWSAIFLTGVFGAAWISREPRRPNRENDFEDHRLIVSEESLDFGTVIQQPELVVEIPITNSSSDPVEIVSFRKTCTCTSINPSKIVVPPRSTQTVVATLDLTPRSISGSAGQSRPFSVDIAAEIGGTRKKSKTWKIHGQVRSLLLAEPPSLFMVIDKLKPNAIGSFRIHTDPIDEVSRLEIEPFEGVKSRVEREGNGDFLVSFEPDIKSVSGDFSWRFKIVASNESGKQIDEMEYKVFGKTIGDVIALPDSLVFNGVSRTQENHKTLTIRSRSGRRIVKAEILLPVPAGLQLTLNATAPESVLVDFDGAQNADLSAREVEWLRLRVGLNEAEQYEDVTIPIFKIGF